MSRLDEIKEREAAASRGPWTHETEGLFGGDAGDVILTSNKAVVASHVWTPDAEFICHSREDVPWLLGKITKLETELYAARLALYDCRRRR